MGVTNRKYFQLKKFDYTCGSTMCLYLDLEKAGPDTNSEQDHGMLLPRILKQWDLAACIAIMRTKIDRKRLVGVLLTCSSEPTNVSIRYAVVLTKEGMTIGHILRNIFKIRSFFTAAGSTSHQYHSTVAQVTVHTMCTYVLLF